MSEAPSSDKLRFMESLNVKGAMVKLSVKILFMSDEKL